MKEYKMVKQAQGFMKVLKDEEFMDLLNQEARGGWRLVSVVAGQGGHYMKAILERER